MAVDAVGFDLLFFLGGGVVNKESSHGNQSFLGYDPAGTLLDILINFITFSAVLFCYYLINKGRDSLGYRMEDRDSILGRSR
jgi:hypothetical protein